MSEAAPRVSKRSAARGTRLKNTIDVGPTRDKVPGFDRRAAPLERMKSPLETPPIPDGEDQAAGSSIAPAEQVANRKGNDPSIYRVQDRLIWP
jgi:hypothetical protein